MCNLTLWPPHTNFLIVELLEVHGYWYRYWNWLAGFKFRPKLFKFSFHYVGKDMNPCLLTVAMDKIVEAGWLVL